MDCWRRFYAAEQALYGPRGVRFQGEVRFAARGQVDPAVFGIRLKTVARSGRPTLGALDSRYSERGTKPSASAP
jgi:hypothetical protein